MYFKKIYIYISQFQETLVRSSNTQNQPGSAPRDELIQMLQTVISNQERLATKVIVLEKGMQQIHSQLITMNANSSRPHSAMSVASGMSSASASASLDAPIEFKLIDDENDLNKFEETIADPNQRKKMIDYFVGIIGVNSENTQRTVALQLSRKMTTEFFWAKTAWSGGRKMDNPKFAFAKHIGIIGFINEVISQSQGSRMSERAMAEFVKVRTRNSGYTHTSSRIAASRHREKNKPNKNIEEEDGRNLHYSSGSKDDARPDDPNPNNSGHLDDQDIEKN